MSSAAPVSPEIAGPLSPPDAAAAFRLPGWAEAVVILLAILAAYVPVLSAGFIWDDDAHLTAPHLRSGAGLARIWTEPGATQQYYPLLHSVFWLEHRLWGGSPLGYHAANILFHGLAATLLLLVLRRLGMQAALPAALLFALHPVHVESVAWITEQKNTLSLIFYLLAAWAYLGFDASRRRSHYAGALACFVLALLTKTVTASLPAALLVVAWWRRGRLDGRRDVAPLVPWFLLGAGAGLFTAWAERTLIGADGAAFALSWLERWQLCGQVIAFYAGKLLWPQNLTFIYPRWELAAGDAVRWLPLLGVAAVTGTLWSLRRRWRGPLAAWLFFCGSLFPVLGFLNVYPFKYSYVADHFQYLASLGLLVPAAGLLRPRLLAPALLALGILTNAQSRMYRDAETLFRTTIVRNDACWMAYNNLGQLWMNDPARRPAAIAHFERALALHPGYYEALNNLGLALTQAGRPREAIPHLEAALRLKPSAYQSLNNLGIALASSGQAERALAVFATAARLNPSLPNIRENWGKALLLLGRRAEAEQHFSAAAQLRAAASAP